MAQLIAAGIAAGALAVLVIVIARSGRGPRQPSGTRTTGTADDRLAWPDKEAARDWRST